MPLSRIYLEVKKIFFSVDCKSLIKPNCPTVNIFLLGKLETSLKKKSLDVGI